MVGVLFPSDEKPSGSLATGVDQTSAKCDFSRAVITESTMGSDEVNSRRMVNGCWQLQSVKNSGGMMEVIDLSGSSPIVARYFANEMGNASSAQVRTLNVVTSQGQEESIAWRAAKGHSIFVANSKKGLSFIYGDNQPGGRKGSLIFEF